MSEYNSSHDTFTNLNNSEGSAITTDMGKLNIINAQVK